MNGGENASHIVDPKRRAEHIERLQSVGIDTARLQESGRFVLCDWADAHFKNGRFDQEQMLALAETMMEASKGRGVHEIVTSRIWNGHFRTPEIRNWKWKTAGKASPGN